MTDRPITVHKHAAHVPVAEAPCGTCRLPMLYNLVVGILIHPDGLDGACDEPWPHVPRPPDVTAAIEQARADLAVLTKAGPLLDALMLGPQEATP